MFLLQHLTAYEGYQWFLPTWFTPKWWDTDFFNEKQAQGMGIAPVPCTTQEMGRVIQGHMSLSNAFFGPEDSAIVGNLTVAQWKVLYLQKIESMVGFCF